MNTFNHMCWLINKKSWSDETNYSGGHLVSINSQAEDDWIKDLVKALDGQEHSYWIGGYFQGNKLFHIIS